MPTQRVTILRENRNASLGLDRFLIMIVAFRIILLIEKQKSSQ